MNFGHRKGMETNNKWIEIKIMCSNNDDAAVEWWWRLCDDDRLRRSRFSAEPVENKQEKEVETMKNERVEEDRRRRTRINKQKKNKI